MRSLLALALVTACASDDGAAPAIAALAYGPSTVPAGQTTVVAGTFTFTDDDGDLAELGAEITLPDGSAQQLPMTALGNVGDMTSGTLGFQLSITPPVAGAYAFALWITDDAEHASNRLTGTLTAP